MAQMRLLEKQKEKAEIEIATLEKIQVETRGLIQKTFQTCSAHLLKEIKTNVKHQIAEDIKALMKVELKMTMDNFTKELASTVSTDVRAAVQAEISASNAPAAAVSGGVKLPERAAQGGRTMMRGDFGNKKEVKRMVTRRKTTMKRKAIRESFTRHQNSVFEDEQPTDGGRDSEIGAPLISNSWAPKADELSPRSQEQVDLPEEQSLLHRIVTHSSFEYFMSATILVSAIILGVKTDYLSRTVGQEAPRIFAILDVVTYIIFAIELSFRLALHRVQFFFNEDENVLWNWFDFVVVASQTMEICFGMFVDVDAPSSMKAFRLVRVIRLLRLLRLARLVRLMRVFMELRMIATLLIATLRSLFGAIAVLVLVIYLVGVCVTEQVLAARQEMSLKPYVNMDEQESLEGWFGSLTSTMLTMYQLTTNGLDWREVVEELAENVSPMMLPFFCLYVAFFFFAITNVITGIFVKQSMEAAQESQDDAMVVQINNLFNKQDGLGDITYKEYEEMIKLPEMVALFKAINIDASEASLLYRLLDEDEDGRLCYEEFINGALRLRGPAKALELAMYVKESAAVNRWLSSKMISLDNSISSIVHTCSANGDKLNGLEALLLGGPAPHQEQAVVVYENTEQMMEDLDPAPNDGPEA